MLADVSVQMPRQSHDERQFGEFGRLYGGGTRAIQRRAPPPDAPSTAVMRRRKIAAAYMKYAYRSSQW